MKQIGCAMALRSLLDVSPVEQSQVRGDSHQSPRGRLGIQLLWRGGIQPFFIHHHVLGRGPLASEQSLVGTPDPVPLLEATNPHPHGCNGPRHNTPDEVGKLQRHRDRTAADIQIDRVDRHRPHADQNLSLLRNRFGKFSIGDDIRSTSLLDVRRTHERRGHSGCERWDCCGGTQRRDLNRQWKKADS